MPSFLKSMRNVFWGRGDLQERGATAEDLGAGHGDASGGVDGLLALSRPQAMATSPAKAGGGAARARAVLSPLHDSNTPQQSPMDEDGTAPSKDPPKKHRVGVRKPHTLYAMELARKHVRVDTGFETTAQLLQKMKERYADETKSWSHRNFSYYVKEARKDLLAAAIAAHGAGPSAAAAALSPRAPATKRNAIFSQKADAAKKKAAAAKKKTSRTTKKPKKGSNAWYADELAAMQAQLEAANQKLADQQQADDAMDEDDVAEGDESDDASMESDDAMNEEMPN